MNKKSSSIASPEREPKGLPYAEQHIQAMGFEKQIAHSSLDYNVEKILGTNFFAS